MTNAPIINLGNIVESNAVYSQNFYENLFQRLEVTAQSDKYTLKQSIKLAADAYLTHYGNYERELPAHEIKDKLEKSLKHIEKAIEHLTQVSANRYYSEALTNNLFDVIDKKYPSLNSLLNEIIRTNDFFVISSPTRSLDLLSAMTDGIEQTLKNFESEKKPNKSEALYHWIMILSAKLEPIIGHKLEQSQYYKGEYISKREISDSELLLFIIKPLAPNVTQSQIETAIKDTRQERHDAPWHDYF